MIFTSQMLGHCWYMKQAARLDCGNHAACAGEVDCILPTTPQDGQQQHDTGRRLDTSKRRTISSTSIRIQSKLFGNFRQSLCSGTRTRSHHTHGSGLTHSNHIPLTPKYPPPHPQPTVYTANTTNHASSHNPYPAPSYVPAYPT